MTENWEKYAEWENMKYHTQNESGRFWCNEDGMLTGLEVAEKNGLSQPPFGFGSFVPKRCMQKLVLPEGLRVIGEIENLRDLIVVEQLIFPATLEKLEAGVLSGSLIMEMTLPATLREIGPGALMCSYIHVLRIPRGLPHPKLQGWEKKKADGVLTVYGRQFKETIIDTLIVPRDYPYEQLTVETKINRIVYSD